MKIDSEIKKILIGLCILSGTSAQAKVVEHMNDFLSKQGLLVNSTAPSAHKDQSAGHLSAGGFRLNGANRNINLLAAQAPGYAFNGCNQISLHGGAFSFITSKELLKTLRNVGNGVAVYSAMILLETLCPVCKKTVDQLQKMAQEVNGWSQNECLLSAQITGSLWPKTAQSQQALCEQLALSNNTIGDYAAGRQQCSDYNEQRSLMNRVKNAADKDASSLNADEQKWARFQNQSLDEGNVVWRILSQPGFLASGLDNTDMKQFIMTLTGSVILSQDAGNKTGHVTVLESMAGKQDFEKALLYGGANNKTKIWHCDKAEGQFSCLKPDLKDVEIPEKNTFVAKIQTQLESIQNKLITGTELSVDEQQLVSRVSLLPIEAVLNVQTAYSHAPSILPLQKIADLVAADILCSYLTDMIEVVELGMNRIDVAQEHKSLLLKNIAVAKQRLRVSVEDRYQQTQLMLSIVERTEKIKQRLNAAFSSKLQQVISQKT